MADTPPAWGVDGSPSSLPEPRGAAGHWSSPTEEKGQQTVDAASAPERVLAPAYPTLWPHMLLPTWKQRPLPFPFNEPGARYFYFARNGIYALARLWGLAGQEILFPAYCHGVELEALLAAQVRLRFYPVHSRFRIEVGEVVARLRPETRAVYLIHYAGFPGPVEELVEVCRQRNLLLIEDCALALLSALGDRPLGSFGDAAIFCLYKTLPVPNGGAVVVRRDGPGEWPRIHAPSLASTLAQAASSLSLNLELRGKTWGRRVLKALRASGKAASRTLRAERVDTGTQHFEDAHADLAMSRLSHRILERQDFSSIVKRRRRNYAHLLARLGPLSPPVRSELPPGVCPLFYPLRARDKRAVVPRLVARGVEAVEFWRHEPPGVSPGAFPEVDDLRRTIVELPCHQDLTPQGIDRIADRVGEVLREVG